MQVRDFLFNEDLPSKMPLSCRGRLYVFRTTEECMTFAMGISLALDENAK